MNPDFFTYHSKLMQMYLLGLLKCFGRWFSELLFELFSILSKYKKPREDEHSQIFILSFLTILPAKGIIILLDVTWQNQPLVPSLHGFS